LAKIEIVVSDKDARKVVEIISKNSGLSSNHGGKIFVSEMEEVGLDISEHAERAYSDEEEFKLDMDSYTEDLKDKDEILRKKK